MPDPTIITSPLSGPFTESGITVDVQIYRLHDTKWSLEVVDSKGTSTVWDDFFDTDEAAKAEFHPDRRGRHPRHPNRRNLYPPTGRDPLSGVPLPWRFRSSDNANDPSN